MASIRDMEIPQDHTIQMIVRNDRRIVIWFRKLMVEIEQIGRRVVIHKIPYREEGDVDDEGYMSDVEFDTVNEAYAAELEEEQKV